MSEDGGDGEYVPSQPSETASPVASSKSTVQKRERSPSPSKDAGVDLKHSRMPDDEEDDDPAVSAVAEDNAARKASFESWKASVRGTLASCVEAVNAFKREMGGVKPLHQHEVRDHVAYYKCGFKQG